MNTPSIKTIAEGLRLNPGQARQIKDLISGKTEPSGMVTTYRNKPHHMAAILEACNAIGEFAGVEYIADNRDRDNLRDCYGLSYLNASDTYAATLIYDHAASRYSVTSIGDILESPRHAKRFD